MKTIRELFSTRRKIDRRIEKVIDYYADDEERLASEIEEYEATDNVEACFRRFLETYQAGVQAGQVTEVGMWVAGFYGSGKSSFTKYLGFALDPERTVHGQPFLDLLADRLRSPDVKANLRTVAKRSPTAVVLLDLGAEQLAESTAATVTNVLYWKVLQLAGFSKEKKLAQLEFTLDERELYDDFRAAYRQAHGEEWEQIHNDPLLGVSRASRLLPSFLPQDFPEPDSFSKLRFSMADDVRDLAQQMIDMVRRHTGRENILFLIDEAGQYVAPRGELILNLDGLARNLKELGQGKVWIVATGQQTLSEIVERAAHNSPELNKLRDRFPISIELDARDIREITYRRLLTKSDAGEDQLRALFRASGQALVTHTRLAGTTFFKDDPTAADFVRYYPFLPQHFEVLMALIRVLARGTGGIGLRSAIRVIQDVLVDTSRILPPAALKLADRPVGRLACVDDFYVTLRADINKLLPHIVTAVDQVERAFPNSGLHLRVAQAVAALQPLEPFPRTVENIAALLYPKLGSPSLLDDVRQALADLTGDKEIGLIEDPQAGGYLFLSASVRPLQRKRSEYAPTGGEVTRVRNQILQTLLEPQPATRLENVRDVRAAARIGKHWLVSDREEIRFQLEMAPGGAWDERRAALLAETAQQTEYQNVIVWLFRRDDVAEDILPEVRKSEKIAGEVDERTADRDLAQYARAERRLAG
ncbi:MAG: BREX system P-loop protein BrxC, partial [Chloroflexota bacterium]|nr:BREX system P-loop protein BrxC [Chloroflexota bacterium]